MRRGDDLGDGRFPLRALRAIGLAICLGLAMVVSATAQPVRSDTTRTDTVASSSADPWLGRDKAMHAAASFGLAISGQLILTEGAGLDADRALPVSAGTTLVLGVMKELTDRRRDHNPLFSWRDLVADALGIAVAALVVGL